MKTVVGVYETREEGTKAVSSLTRHGFTNTQVTLVNKDELLHNHISIKPHSALQRSEILIGLLAGLLIGAIIGMGIFDFAPLHFVYRMGIVRGAIAGSIFGLWIGTLISFLITVIEGRMLSSKYEKHLNDGKFLVVLDGNKREISSAHKIIHTPDLELELD